MDLKTNESGAIILDKEAYQENPEPSSDTQEPNPEINPNPEPGSDTQEPNSNPESENSSSAPEIEMPAGLKLVKPNEKPEPVENPEWFDSFKETFGIDAETVLEAQEMLKPQPKQINEPAVQFKDDYIKNLVNYYNENGTAEPFLRAYQPDKIKNMSHEDIMRRKLEQEYPGFDKESLDRLYQENVVNKYKINPEEHDEADVKFGKQLLARDAEIEREKELKSLEQFIAPAPEDKMAEAEAAQKKWQETISGLPETNRLLQEGSIQFNYKDQTFAYQLDSPQDAIEMANDNRKFWDMFFSKEPNEDGSRNFDMALFAEVVALAQNPEKYRNSIAGMGVTVSTMEHQRELRKGGGKKPEPATKDREYSSFAEGFLKAAKEQRAG